MCVQYFLLIRNGKIALYKTFQMPFLSFLSLSVKIDFKHVGKCYFGLIKCHNFFFQS